MENNYDLIVIGSGPGGYVAAIKAAKLGMKTAIIEGREIGGTCLNRGCIPTKTLMHSSHLYQEAKSLQEAGIRFEGLSFDMDQLQNRKEEVVNKIRQGIVSLLEANGVTILRGTAKILSANRVAISTNVTLEEDAGKLSYDSIENKDDKVKAEGQMNCELEAGKILIATGSKPTIPRIEGADLSNVITSDELLSCRKLYKKLLIIGGGVIGIEFASIYRDLGCEVEIIEAMDRILPNMDKELSQSVGMSLKKKGAIIHTKSKVVRIAEGDNQELICEYEEKDTLKTASADGILISVGRRANTEGLFSPEVAVEYDGANIKVNENFASSIPGIYAIGDAIKGKQLAHAASAQGIVAVERMLGLEPSIDLSVIPSCIYTTPEVAAVGLSEEEAVLQGYSVKTGKYLMLGNSKTVLSNGERGFIKVICDAASDKIIGAQLLCDRATDMVSEFGTAIVNGLTVKDVASVVRPHPTYSEAITEAVEDIEGMAIHLVPRRK
jgi:dihydrolipoamide dehydrogenase